MDRNLFQFMRIVQAITKNNITNITQHPALNKSSNDILSFLGTVENTEYFSLPDFILDYYSD